MNEEPILLEHRGAVASITLNRPLVLNGIDEGLAAELGEAIERATELPSVRAVLLSGAGRAFCAGGDLSRFDGGEKFGAVAERTMSVFHPVVRRIATLPVPTVVAVHGAVAGAGIGLMLACDFVLAATGTRFTLAYPRIGGTIDAGASWFLVRALGTRKAMELAILAETFDADAAHGLGLVNRVVPTDALGEEAFAFSERLATGPTAAYGAIKRLVACAHGNDLPAQLDAEQAAFVTSAATDDFAEGLVAFREKRQPLFTGK